MTQDMKISEVRKCLSIIRTMWKQHSMQTPMCLSTILFTGETVSEFAHRVILAQHVKRVKRVRDR